MIEDVNSLPDDPALLKKLLTKQAARVMFLEEQFRLVSLMLLKKRVSRRSPQQKKARSKKTVRRLTA